MSTGGYAQGGASGFGPSAMYSSLPWKGWRETGTWIEEFIDACGLRFDNVYSRYISASARSNLLDPTVTPSDVPSQYLATAIAAGKSSPNSDTMLDILLFIALGVYPSNSNLSIAQKQALVQVGWQALRRKGTRAQLLNVASQLTSGIASGWTVPGNFSIIVPDGAPAPGQGLWSPPSGIQSIQRPWVFAAIRQSIIQPAFLNVGVGYSQFRAGYSAAGESVFPSGSTTNLILNEHFSTFTGSNPNSWTCVNTVSTTAATQINYEFTTLACLLDQTSAASGSFARLIQKIQVNNQLTHRFELDYSYTNTQNVGNLNVLIYDQNDDGNTYYWNATTSTWVTTMYQNVAPARSTRARYSFDVVPRKQTSLTNFGTRALNVQIFTASDGTASTQIRYTLYRVGVYEKFSLPVETAAYGERTLWLPLIDAPGLAVATRSTASTIAVPANGARSQYRVLSGSTVGSFPYHPSLSSSGLACHGTWTNLLKGSNSFTTDWSVAAGSITAAAGLSPTIGETSPTAPKFTTSSAVGNGVFQSTSVTPTNRSYVCGIWVNKLSADSTVTLTLNSTTSRSQTFSSTSTQGWQWLSFVATFGSGDTTTLSFTVSAAASGSQFLIASSYLYDVTGMAAVLYPPICISPVGSTAVLYPTTCTPLTAAGTALSPTIMRQEAAITRGALGLTIVPMFDAASQPNGVLFDTAQGAAQNRVVLRVASGVLELRRWDASGNQWVASLTLTKSATPASGAMTWLRDTAIVIRGVWDSSSQQLSAGNGNAVGTVPGTWAPTDTNTAIAVGNDYTGANPFSGILTALEVDQNGSPSV